jgi:hypothetical protein
MYGLEPMRMAELTRVALTSHRFEVSRMIRIALGLLRRRNPGLRLIVSLADPVRGHMGAIYQAGNWVYVGETAKSKTYIDKSGREYHERNVHPSGRKVGRWTMQTCLRPQDAASVRTNPGKHKYLMPLDDAMRAQIEPLRKPYPKRAKQASAGDQLVSGGAAPTCTLQKKAALA